MDYLTAVRILAPFYDTTRIVDPGLVREVAAYRSTNYTLGKQESGRNNTTVRIYEGQYSGELFKVREV